MLEVVLVALALAPALLGESVFELCVAGAGPGAPVKGVSRAPEDAVSNIQSERNRECVGENSTESDADSHWLYKSWCV